MEKTRKIIPQIRSVILVAAAIAISSYGNSAEVSIMGISIGDSLEDVQITLSESCESPEIFRHDTLSFPLAETSEAHAVCKNLSIGGRIAVVLADGSAVHIQAENLNTEYINMNETKGRQYLGYNIYENGSLWINEPGNKAVLVSPDAIHPNLYVWENPYLNDVAEEEMEPNPTVFPSVLMFGHSYTEVKAAIQDSCDPIREQETDVWLLNEPKQQRQIDCFNYDYLGFPRKFELVFGDDVLQLAWILTAKQEEERVRTQLRTSFGEPIAINQIAEIYADGRIALRMDKPEVLALSEEVAPLYLERYSKAGESTP